MSDDVMHEEGWFFVDGATTGFIRCGLPCVGLAVAPSTYQGLKQYRVYYLKVFGRAISEPGT